VLVFVVRGQDREAESTRLTGKTSRDRNVGLTLVDGRVRGFVVYPSGFCRPQRVWRSWLWYVPSSDARVKQEGSRFTARQRSSRGARGQRVEWRALITGELEDGGSAARGTIRATWSYGDGPGYEGAACQGTVRFTARRNP
jgi:hypothetical protein